MRKNIDIFFIDKNEITLIISCQNAYTETTFAMKEDNRFSKSNRLFEGNLLKPVNLYCEQCYIMYIILRLTYISGG